MTDAPTGTLTLVFTDIQGSTALWERLGDDFGLALQQHDALVRAALVEHGGYEVKTEGDAFMVAFDGARAAIEFCLDAQRRLHAAEWADSLLAQPECAAEGGFRGVRVRMGVHTGEPACRPDPNTGRMDYFGPMVNRAARVEAAAHGGQIVVSAAAWSTSGLGEAPVGLAVKDLGLHALKGLSEPEHLRQLLPRGLDGRTFPAPRTVERRRTNLVPMARSFVGRQQEQRDVLALFDDGRRLVTLLGPGGTGKTALARRIAGALLPRLAGGAWFCDLSEARTRSAIHADVAGVLDVPLGTSDAQERLGNAIRGRGPMLLLLDNVEQVVEDAAAVVGAWQDRAPQAIFLVTSRTPLHLASEQLVPIDPLPTEAAVKLFVDRAQQVKPGFRLSGDARADVLAIVRELDGLPLAIELAAARVRMLPPRTIRARLKRRFDLLKGSRRDVSDRQATLRGAIDGSWDLLGEPERAGLAQCSVFAGSFSLEAAEAVLDLGEDGPWPMDAVEALVDQSLVRMAIDPGDGEPRYELLSSIRAYADEKLDADARAGAEARHAGWFATLGDADRLGELYGPDEEPRFAELVRDRENLLVAVDRAADLGLGESAAGAARAVAAIVEVRGPVRTGVDLLERVLAVPDLGEGDRASVVRTRAMLARDLLPADEVAGWLEEALTGARAAGERGVEADTLRDLGILRRRQGRLDEAEDLLQQAEALHRRLGARARAALDVESRASLAWTNRKVFDAERLFEQALGELRGVRSRRGEGIVLANLGTLRLQQHRLDDAEADLREALVAVGAAAYHGPEAYVLASLATLARRRGQLDEAARFAEEALRRTRVLGDRRREGQALATAGTIDLARGRAEPARTRFDAALVVFRELGDLRSEAVALGNLGRAWLKLGVAEQAEEAFRRAVILAEAGSWEAIEGAFRGALGEALAQQGRSADAFEQLRRGEILLREAARPAELGWLLARRARLQARGGEMEQAETTLSELGTLAERTASGPGSELMQAVEEIREALENELD